MAVLIHIRKILELLLKKYLRDYLFLLGVAAIIITSDQISKSLIRNRIPFGEVWSPWDWLLPYVRFVHWSNTGAAFGMLPGLSTVFTILAILVAVVILYYFPQVPRTDWALRLAMSLQFGGAIGNLIDRLTEGHVTDFISVGTFPVFNIADASISVGVAILLLGMWLKDREERANLHTSEKQDNNDPNLPARVSEDLPGD